MTSQADHAPDGITVLEALRSLEEQGYTAQLAAEPDGVRCFTCRTLSPAADVRVVSLCRTEGASDPADMVAVAAVRCPSCHASGTIALKYGPGATPEEAELLALADDRERRSSTADAG